MTDTVGQYLLALSMKKRERCWLYTVRTIQGSLAFTKTWRASDLWSHWKKKANNTVYVPLVTKWRLIKKLGGLLQHWVATNASLA